MESTEPQGNLREMTFWDRSAIVLLGAAGFVFSYDALRQIALAIHARESLSFLFPVFVDGFIAYGVRAIVLLRHQRFAARLYAWFLFLAATGASLGANSLHAVTLNDSPHAGRSALHLTDSVVGGLSMLAPLALAGSVHLYILMARTAERAVPDRADTGPGPVREMSPALEHVAAQHRPFTSEAHAPVPPWPLTAGPSVPPSSAAELVDLRKADSLPCQEGRAEVAAARPSAEADGRETASESANGPDGDGPDGVPSTAVPESTESSVPRAVRVPADEEKPPVPDDSDRPQDREANGRDDDAESSVPKAVRVPADEEKPPVPDDADRPQDREADDDWAAELLPIARAAAERAGRTSREVVGEAVRRHRAISNDRLGLLLARLKEEGDEVAEEPVTASSALW
ncbi:DUF2637 domain-containing protein [Streptomyces sp. NPDC002690]